MENRKLGFGRITSIVAISAILGGGTGGVVGGLLAKREFANRCAPLTGRLQTCPASVADLYSLDELRVLTQKGVKDHATEIREELGVDGNAYLKIVFSLEIKGSGDVKVISVSPMCGSEKCEGRSDSALMVADRILDGEALEPPPQACRFNFEVEVPTTNSCR